MNQPIVEILTPRSPAEFDTVREIFREYAASLNIDLRFQGFEQELANLPGDYATPRGGLLLARIDGQTAGCCALRPMDSTDYPNACEMKRLYVRPAFRGLGLGRRLAQAILDTAHLYAYDHVLLDTLNEMEAARALYEDLGFVEVPTYYHNPIAGAHYLMATLSDTRL